SGLGSELYENLALLLKKGFHAVELSVASWAVKTGNYVHRETDLDLLREALQPFRQVTIHATYHNHSGLSFLTWCEPIRDAYFEELKFTLNVARRLGATIVTFHPGGPFDSTPDPETYQSEPFFKEVLSVELQRLNDLYTDTGVILGLENADYFQPAEYFEFFRDLKLDAIKITLDTNHMSKPHAGKRVHNTTYNAYEKYGSISGFVKSFGKDIVHVHLNDYDPENCLGCGHLPVGDGVVNMPEILQALKDVGYRNMLSFELDNIAGICRAKDRTEKILDALGRSVSNT
ncbi:MAG: sugar phosphate isomerase/epimerase, partial [Kiritimatiellae bacterium]|nr:sugar phosphate isomerase/epimerase [Kiritimatiellia bacterium]